MIMTEKNRCQWCVGIALYEKYHDEEWGVPVYDDQKLFEFLILETFQAGLSWITILKKRENFRLAFDHFDYLKVALYSENKIQESLGSHSKITVLVDDEETTFEMSQKQTILEAALKQGVDAPYSCQGGICSSCMARVTVGTAEMKKNSILTDKELAEGLVLTCQAHPTSDTIFVDFDDV